MRHPLPNSGARTAAIAAACASLMLLAAGIRDRAAAAPAPEVHHTVPAGTSIVGSLQSTISTGKNHVGDPVRLRLLHSVRLSGKPVIPANSTLHGEVTHVDPAGRIAGGAELTIRFTKLTTPDGRSYAISAVPIRLKGKGQAKESAEEIGGGAVAGGVVGGILGGKKSVLKGAAAGAVVGTGVAVETKGKQIVLPAGQRMRVTLNSPVSIRVKSIQT